MCPVSYDLMSDGPAKAGETFPVEPAFEPPNANGDARLQMEFFQDVLHVFLHGALAAPEDLANLAVAFSFRDPFHDFELPLRQRCRLRNRTLWSRAL